MSRPCASGPPPRASRSIATLVSLALAITTLWTAGFASAQSPTAAPPTAAPPTAAPPDARPDEAPKAEPPASKPSPSRRKPTAAELKEARGLFQSGARAYAAGRFLVAIRAFDQAYAIAPRPSIRFSAAQALRRQYAVDGKVAHLTKARRFFRGYLKEVKQGRRVKDAAEAVTELDIQLSKLRTPANGDPTTPGPDGAPDPASPDGAQPEVGTLDLNNTPPGAFATIGGKKRPESLPGWIELPPGEHVLVVQAPGYKSLRRTLRLRSGVTVLDAALEPLPGLLKFTGDVNCDIVVDGRSVGRTPLTKPLELTSGSHRIVVGKSGRSVFRRTISLKRGETETIDVDLSLTAQRVAAWGFVGSAAAATATGIVFTFMARSRRVQARDLNNLRGSRDLTEAEADEHNGLISTSDNLTGIALGSYGLALVSSVLSLSLFVLDSPDLYDAGDGADDGPEGDSAGNDEGGAAARPVSPPITLQVLPNAAATPNGGFAAGLTVSGTF